MTFREKTLSGVEENVINNVNKKNSNLRSTNSYRSLEYVVIKLNAKPNHKKACLRWKFWHANKRYILYGSRLMKLIKSNNYHRFNSEKYFSQRILKLSVGKGFVGIWFLTAIFWLHTAAISQLQEPSTSTDKDARGLAAVGAQNGAGYNTHELIDCRVNTTLPMVAMASSRFYLYTM